jgi:hypothetical protein
MSTPATAPRRCFVIDLPSVSLKASRTSPAQLVVRLMGTVVTIQQLSANTGSSLNTNCDNSSSSQDELMLLELDDGTGSIVCLTPMATMDRLVTLKIGNLVDCIGRLLMRTQQLDSTDTSNANHTSSNNLVVQVDTLLEVLGSPVAEWLRWMEICTPVPEQSQQWNRNKLAHGYPCPEVSSDDILQIIESDQREGVNLSDLACVLDLEQTQAKTLIEDLQMQGLIYENEKGLFVPL